VLAIALVAVPAKSVADVASAARAIRVRMGGGPFTDFSVANHYLSK
jgi:hypothetical protein